MWPPDQSLRPHWAETVREAEAEQHRVPLKAPACVKEGLEKRWSLQPVLPDPQTQSPTSALRSWGFPKSVPAAPSKSQISTILSLRFELLFSHTRFNFCLRAQPQPRFCLTHLLRWPYPSVAPAQRGQGESLAHQPAGDRREASPSASTRPGPGPSRPRTSAFLVEKSHSLVAQLTGLLFPTERNQLAFS